MKFTLQATDGKARAALVQTAHGEVATPIFMPVGTQASVKALDSVDMDELQAPIILANTYHLYLRPGEAVVEQMGGLHGFSGFKKAFLTDSGGFQAFSLSEHMKIGEEGIKFKSHIDGSLHLFTPSKVVDIQHALGSDIMMPLDDLIALPAEHKRLVESVERTTRWAKESLERHDKVQKEGRALDSNLFCIVQGGVSQQFRKKSASELLDVDVNGRSFDGFAIGGLSVGEESMAMYDTVEFTTPFLPAEKPRYLMGVGTPEDIIECIDRGVDMFDCVMPTRNARNGTLFTSFGRLNIKRAQFITDCEPIDKECDCHTCRNYSRAYMSHLLRAHELSFYRLASIHNLRYYLRLVFGAREAIMAGRWGEYKKEFYAKRREDG